MILIFLYKLGFAGNSLVVLLWIFFIAIMCFYFVPYCYSGVNYKMNWNNSIPELEFELIDFHQAEL